MQHLTFNPGAIFSDDRTYRYALFRTWDQSKTFVMFVGLNPSTADENTDDPTIRRCIGFAKDWGFGGICMTNLFAIRATDPKVMLAAADPIGGLNDFWLQTLSSCAGQIVAAWGVHGSHMGRDKYVFNRLPPMVCLGTTKHWHPRHPLYVRKDAVLQPLVMVD